MEDVFAIYKPKGLTSNGVLQELKRASGVRSMGHAGTLDPLAKGVLVIGMGKSGTKKLSSLLAHEKEYRAVIELGANSTTDDAEGEKTPVKGARKPAKEEIEEALKHFKGIISQVPPVYSAIKVGGKEAYKLARKGESPDLKPRNVEIKALELIRYQWPCVEIRVVCGAGTYIRSLARDLGEALGTGGFLSDLERTRVGDFTKEHAMSIEEFKNRFHNPRGI